MNLHRPASGARFGSAQSVALAVLGCVLALGCNPTSHADSSVVGSTPSAAVPDSTVLPSAVATTPCDPSGTSSWTLFQRGVATLDFTAAGESEITLDRIANTTFKAGYDAACPGVAQAEWTDPTGHWLLTVLANTGPNDAFGGQWGTLSIQGYESEPPLYADGSPCQLAISEVTEARLAGHAACRGLRWLNDYDAQTNPENAVPIASMAPFDVSIAFEAYP